MDPLLAWLNLKAYGRGGVRGSKWGGGPNINLFHIIVENFFLSVLKDMKAQRLLIPFDPS